MKKSTKYIIATVIILILIGTGLYFFLNPKKALNFVIPNFTGLANIGVEIKGDTAYLDVNSIMENKAPYTINVQQITYTISLADSVILDEVHNLNLIQKAGKIDTAELLLHVPYKNAIRVLRNIEDQDSTDVGLKFSITYGTIFGDVTIPVDYTFRIETPLLPEVELNKIKLGFFNFKETKFELILDMDVKNENDFEVAIANLEYEATFGDNLLGYGKMEEVLKIDSNATTNLKLPIIISVDKPMKLIWDIISNKDRMEYALNLRGQIVQQGKLKDDLPFDITLHGEAELVK